MPAVFLGYRRDDSAGYAGRLHESLERRLGRGQVFRDVDTLEPGQDFVRAIESRVRECRIFLALIGPEWLDAAAPSGLRRLDHESDYVRRELAAALTRPEVLLIPVLVDGARMPHDAQLPEAIRSLAYRHALSLRDETWDADVERLVTAMSPALDRAIASRTPGAPPVFAKRRIRNVLVAIVVLAMVVAAIVAGRQYRSGTTNSDDGRVVVQRSAGGGDRPSTAAGAASPISIPRIAELAYGDLIYTILSGTVAARGNELALRLRVRFSNEGAYPANFWNSSFSLALNGDVLAPTGDLNEVVAGHSVRTEFVEFTLPSARPAVLRVTQQNKTAELPLDLTPVAPSVAAETGDGDALSRAIVRRVVDEPKPLAGSPDVSFTLTRVVSRRFVNVLRIVVSVNAISRGRYPTHISSDLLRLVVDGQPTAPITSPNHELEGDTSASVDYVFDVPPTTTHVVLRSRWGSATAELPIELEK